MKWTTNVDYIIGDGYTNPRTIMGGSYKHHTGDKVTIHYKYGSPSPTSTASFTFDFDESVHSFENYTISVNAFGNITITVEPRAAATGFKIKLESIVSESPSFSIFRDDKSISPLVVLYAHTYADSMDNGYEDWSKDELADYGIDNVYDYTILKTDFNVSIDKYITLDEVDQWHSECLYIGSKYPYYVAASINQDNTQPLHVDCYNRVSDSEHRFYFWVRIVLLKVR